jgi:hypothetical protein
MGGHGRSHKQHTHTDREVSGAGMGACALMRELTLAEPCRLPAASDFSARRSSSPSPRAVAALPASGTAAAVASAVVAVAAAAAAARDMAELHVEHVRRPVTALVQPG